MNNCILLYIKLAYKIHIWVHFCISVTIYVNYQVYGITIIYKILTYLTHCSWVNIDFWTLYVYYLYKLT